MPETNRYSPSEQADKLFEGTLKRMMLVAKEGVMAEEMVFNFSTFERSLQRSRHLPAGDRRLYSKTQPIHGCAHNLAVESWLPAPILRDDPKGHYQTSAVGAPAAFARRPNSKQPNS